MENTSTGASAVDYSRMIESNNYPASVNSFQQNEINEMWKAGRRMAAVKKLQGILETGRRDKSLL